MTKVGSYLLLLGLGLVACASSVGDKYDSRFDGKDIVLVGKFTKYQPIDFFTGDVVEKSWISSFRTEMGREIEFEGRCAKTKIDASKYLVVLQEATIPMALAADEEGTEFETSLRMRACTRIDPDYSLNL